MADWDDLTAYFGPSAGRMVVADGPALGGEPDARWLPCASPVLGLAWSGDGRWLAAASGGRILGADGTVRVAQPATGRTLRLVGHGRGTHAVAFDPRGWLATAGHDGVVGLWDLEARRGLAIRGPVPRHAVAFLPGGDRLVVGDELAAPGTSSRLFVFDLDPPALRRQEVLEPDHLVEALVPGPDGDALLVHLFHRDGAQRIERRSLATWALTWSSELPVGHHVTGLAWPSEALVVRSVSDLERVRWLQRVDPASGRVIEQRPIERSVVGGLHVDSARDRMATIGAEGTLRLWSLGGFEPLGEGRLGDWPASALALSPDGRHVAVGSATDRGVRILSLP